MSRSASLSSRLLLGAAPAALAMALPQIASAQSFQGSASVEVGGATVNTAPGNTTVNVNAPITVINWQPSDTIGTGEIAFQSAGTTALFESINFADFAVLNRILPVDAGGNPVITRPIRFDGTVNSTFAASGAITAGSIWFYTPGGIVLGANSVFNVGSLVLSTSAIATANVFVGNAGTINFTGTPNINSAIRIENGAQVNALINGSSYVAMVAPRIVQNGTVQVDGSAAYVGAEAATITMDAGSGLFDIAISTGTSDANGVVHDQLGTTSGPGSAGAGDPQRIYMVAIPKNTAISMLVNGNVGYTPAATATVQNGEVILSAGYNITNGAVDLGEHATPVNNVQANLTIGQTSTLSTSFSSIVGARASGNLLASPGTAINGLSILAFSSSAFLFGDASSTLEAGNANELIGVGGNLLLSSRRAGQGGNSAVRAFGGLIAVGGNLTVDASSIGFSGATGGISLSNLNGGIGRGGNASINVVDGNLRITGATSVNANGVGGYGIASMGSGFGGNASVNLSGANAIGLLVGGLNVQGNGFGILSYLASLGLTLAAPEVVAGGNGTGGSALVSIGDINQLTLPAVTIAAAGVGDEGGRALINGGINAGNGGIGRGGTASFNLDSEALVLPGLVLNASGAGGLGGSSDNNPNDLAGNGGAGFGGTATLTLTGTASLSPPIGAGLSVVADASGNGGSGGQTIALTADGGRGGNANGGIANISIGGASQLNASSMLANADANGGVAGGGNGNFADSGSAAGGSATINIATTGAVSVPAIAASANAFSEPSSKTGSAIGGAAGITISNGTVTAADLSVLADGVAGTATPETRRSSSTATAGSGNGGNATLSITGGTVNADSATVRAVGIGSGGVLPDAINGALPLAISGGVGTGNAASVTMSGGTATFTGDITIDASGVGGSGYVSAVNGAAGNGGAGIGGSANINIFGGVLTAANVNLAADGLGGEGGANWGSGAAGAGGAGTGGITQFFAAQEFFLGGLNLTALGQGGAGGVSATPIDDGNGGFAGYGAGIAAGGAGGNGTGGAGILDLDFDPALASLTIDTSGFGGNGGLGLSGGNGGNGAGGAGLGGARLSLFFGDLDVATLIVRSNGTGGLGGAGTGAVGGNGGDATGGDAAVLVDGAGANLISAEMTVEADAFGGAGGSSADGVIGSAGGGAQGGNATLTLANAATATLGVATVSADATGGAGGAGGTGITGASGTGGVIGTNGANGAAPGANGGVGGTGANGGTGGDGLIGGEGGAAGQGLGGIASILVSTTTYTAAGTTITTNGIGGAGGVGGTGGEGGLGGAGGTGGTGGTGANGLDNFVGGSGGAGGDGGQGGLGGTGGTGGTGGAGGNGVQGGFGLGGSASFVSEGATADAGSLLMQSDGIGGTGGLGGTPGLGGAGGRAGSGGAGGTGGAGGFGLSAIGPAGVAGPGGVLGTSGGNGADGFFFGSSAAGFIGNGGLSSLIIRRDISGSSGAFTAVDAVFSSSGLGDALLPDGFAGLVEIANLNGDPAGGVIQFDTLDASALGVSTGNIGPGILMTADQADILITNTALLTTGERIVMNATGQGQIVAGGTITGTAGTDILITHTGQPGLVDTLRGTVISLTADRNFDAQAGSIVRATDFANLQAANGFANVDQLFAVNTSTIAAGTDANLRNATVTGGSLNLLAGRVLAGVPTWRSATATLRGAVTVSDSLLVNSGGDIAVINGANISSGNAAVLNSGDDIIIRNSTISSAQNVTTTGEIQLNVGAITPIDALPGEIRSLVVASSTLTSTGFDMVLAADAIDATTGTFNANRLTATVNNAPPAGVAGGNDGGLLAANCVQGNICLGAVTTPTQILVGPATGTVGLANRVTMGGSLASNNISIRARDGVTFAGPLNAAATNNFLVSVLNGPIDLNGAANLTGNAINLYAGAGAITGPNATLVSGGNVGLFANGGISLGSVDAGGVLNTIANDGTTTTAGSLVTPGNVTVNGLLAVRGGAANINSGGAITTGSVLTTAGNDVLMTSGGAQSLGAVTAGRDLIVNAASLAATSVAAQRNVNAIVSGSATLGNTSGNLITLRAGQDVSFTGTATATTAIDVGSNGQAAFNGAASAPNIAVRSGNILIGAGGRLGTIGTTQNVVLTNSAGAQMTIGGSGVGAGYSLSDAEIARIFGNNIDISWTSNLANTGAPVTPPAGGFTQPSIVVGSLTLSSRAGNAAGNLAANGTLSIRTPGTMQVNGAVALNAAGTGNSITLFADQSLQIVGGQGSIAMRDAANALAGTINLSSASIVAASASAIADIAGLTTAAAITTRLGSNDGFFSDSGILSADTVALNGGNNVFVQNSGSTTLFRDRRGISANTLNISLTNPNGLIVINGQISAAPGFATGLAAIPLLSINGAPSQTAAGFDSLSTMNGCQITAIAACRQQENPISVTEDDIAQPLDPDQAGDNQFPTALIEMKDTESFGYPPLIDEPVTGSGNDDLWPATCDNDNESCPTPPSQ